VLAVLLNTNRDIKRHGAVMPEDLMPRRRHRPTKKIEPLKTDISALKMFLKGT
jgi:hypothetical protein